MLSLERLLLPFWKLIAWTWIVRVAPLGSHNLSFHSSSILLSWITADVIRPNCWLISITKHIWFVMSQRQWLMKFSWRPTHVSFLSINIWTSALVHWPQKIHKNVKGSDLDAPSNSLQVSEFGIRNFHEIPRLKSTKFLFC